MSLTAICLAVTTALAQLDPAWFGHWELNTSLSHLTGYSVEVAPAGERLALRSFSPDDGDVAQTGSGAGAVTLAPVGEREWRLEYPPSTGPATIRSDITVTPDGKQMTIATVAVEGAGEGPSSSEVYDRAAAGAGLPGVWRSRESAFGVADVLDLSAAAGGRIRWAAPNDQQFYLVKPGGPPAAYQGPRGVPNITVALRVVSGHEMRWTEFISGARYVEAVDSLSADGKQLTEVSWMIDKPALRQVAIYDRR